MDIREFVGEMEEQMGIKFKELTKDEKENIGGNNVRYDSIYMAEECGSIYLITDNKNRMDYYLGLEYDEEYLTSVTMKNGNYCLEYNDSERLEEYWDIVNNGGESDED